MQTKTKKASISPLTVLAIVFLGFGIPYIILKMSGYTLVPVNRFAPALLSSLITAAVVFLTFKGVKHRAESTVISPLIPLFSIIFVIGKAIGYDTDGIELYLLPIYACVILLCGMTLFFACVKKKMLRIILGAVYSVLIIPMFIWVLLWDFGPKPVATAEISPNGLYLAEAVRSNQGVFGRHTFVYVSRLEKSVQLPIGVLRNNPIQIYIGEYDEHEIMTLKWETNEIIFINEDGYSLSNIP